MIHQGSGRLLFRVTIESTSSRSTPIKNRVLFTIRLSRRAGQTRPSMAAPPTECDPNLNLIGNPFRATLRTLVTNSVQYQTEDLHIEAAEIIDKLSVLAVHPPEVHQRGPSSFCSTRPEEVSCRRTFCRVRTCSTLNENIVSVQYTLLESPRATGTLARCYSVCPFVCGSGGPMGTRDDEPDEAPQYVGRGSRA